MFAATEPDTLTTTPVPSVRREPDDGGLGGRGITRVRERADDAGHTIGGLQRRVQLREHLEVLGGGQLGGQQQRPIGAGTERLAGQLVGGACRADASLVSS